MMGCWLPFFQGVKKGISLTSLCHRLSQEIQRNLQNKAHCYNYILLSFLTATFRLYIANRQDAETCDLLCHNYMEILSFKSYSDL